MLSLLNTIAAAGLLASPVLAAPSARAASPCGTIAASVKTGYPSVDAQQALDCLQSVPFDKNAAAQFITTYNQTVFQFQSTPAYLKDPPKSYQQPATDLSAGLANILTKVNNGSYKNEYDFEADVQNLIQSAHDGHLSVNTGGLGVFIFTPPMRLTSLSDDGQKAPAVYPFDDVVSFMKQGKDFSGSAITQINGAKAADYLENWASKWQTSFTEPHTDWNGLMTNAADLLAGSAPGWNGTYLFTDEYMNVTYANGSSTSMKWRARVRPRQATKMAKVTDGTSFYQTFVSMPSGSSSASGMQVLSDLIKDAASDAGTKTTGGGGLAKWPFDAYPSPSLAQPGLAQPVNGGESYVTGYMIGDLAVLSMPSFIDSGADAQVFSKTITQFIQMAQKNNANNVLFDVQGNGGGDPLLAYEVYKQFFPGANPFSGARVRSHTAANAIGVALSDAATQPSEKDLNDLLKNPNIGASPWIAQLYNDAVNTSHQWTSWEDWTPPLQDKGDTFSKPFVQVFNRSLFSEALSGDGGANGIVLDGFGNRSEAGVPQPFPTENMAVLTDGLCTSTCTIFVELMHHQAGVKTVVAGGRPVTGPMQMATGSRGAQSYELEQILRDLQLAAKVRPEFAQGSNAKLPLQVIAKYSGIQWTSASINLWDQIRVDASTQGKPSIPLQFTYQAADCRIFYTKDTFNNYTALWQYATNAVLKDQSKCVAGSTGQPSAGTGVTDSAGQAPSSNTASGPSGSTSPSSDKKSAASPRLALNSGLTVSALAAFAFLV